MGDSLLSTTPPGEILARLTGNQMVCVLLRGTTFFASSTTSSPSRAMASTRHYQLRSIPGEPETNLKIVAKLPRARKDNYNPRIAFEGDGRKCCARRCPVHSRSHLAVARGLRNPCIITVVGQQVMGQQRRPGYPLTVAKADK